MAWVALSCPRCSAPFRGVTIWRTVKCASCGPLITKTESVLTRDSFRQALKRARLDSVGADDVVSGGARYHLMQKLSSGEISQVHLARRVGSLPLLTTIELSSSPSAAAIYQREAQVSEDLQCLDGDGVDPYFSRLLPEVKGNHNKAH